eukprot:CAMPEP_0119349882 /NCGR_PEP_ID=MMETSP1333-20130426/109776_1 /TAXON_ID=418940 /ORGANISM="Scyphosphaera apsteinii, Strain RCC1455" /LENGTH=93 /DNA_ID=CAMNT_0007362485 /DNA_START=526 /DNA_END=803 /DNA_ORIENTATION=+
MHLALAFWIEKVRADDHLKKLRSFPRVVIPIKHLKLETMLVPVMLTQRLNQPSLAVGQLHCCTAGMAGETDEADPAPDFQHPPAIHIRYERFA